MINLGTGAGVAVRKIVDHLGKLLGKSELVESVNPPGADPFPFVVADASKLKTLDWRPAWTSRGDWSKW